MQGLRDVKIWRLLLLVSAGVYLLALLSPGLVPDAGGPWTQHAETDGYLCLLFGPLSWLINPIMVVPWSANLFYFVLAVIALRGDGEDISPAAGILPFLIGLSGLGVRASRADIEGGGMVPVHLGSGGWLWLASLLLFAPVLFLKRRGRRAPRAAPAAPAI